MDKEGGLRTHRGRDVEELSILKTNGQLRSQSQADSVNHKTKQKRYKSHPLICTMALVRANTDKQSVCCPPSSFLA